MYVLPILVLAPLYNVPRFFEFRTETNVTYMCSNLVQLNETAALELTEVISEETFRNLSLFPDEVTDVFGAGNGSEAVGVLQRACDGEWKQNSTVNLVVTNFRKNPTYIQVSLSHFGLTGSCFTQVTYCTYWMKYAYAECVTYAAYPLF